MILNMVQVVGSLDANGMRFAGRFSRQPRRQEPISDLTAMASSLLQSFHGIHKKFPRDIIFFRDGVSEHLYPQVSLFYLFSNSILFSFFLNHSISGDRNPFFIMINSLRIKILVDEDRVGNGIVARHQGSSRGKSTKTFICARNETSPNPIFLASGLKQ